MNPKDDRVFSLGWPQAAPVRRVLELAFGLDQLDRIRGARPDGITGEAFLAWLLDSLGVRSSVGQAEFSRIPRSGPVVVVANHPFGGIEGIVLARAHAILKSRPAKAVPRLGAFEEAQW